MIRAPETQIRAATVKRPAVHAAPARRNVTRDRPTIVRHVFVDLCTPTTEQQRPIKSRHVDRTRASLVNAVAATRRITP